MSEKKADLAGPGVGDYARLENELPVDYRSALSPRDTQKAIFALKDFIEERLCEALNLEPVAVPLIVDVESGVNDLLDRDGSRTPIQFHISNDRDRNPVDAQIVQAATKWKRTALKQFGMAVSEGLITDMRAVRKDYFLDHDHSAYVDQWDWELAISENQRTLPFLTSVVEKIWQIFTTAERYIQEVFPQLRTDRHPNLPENITFIHAEDLLDRYPDLPKKQRETRILKECKAVFICGIGWTLKDGYPHEMRAADYDDWVTETVSADGRPMHGLNGDILVWNPVTERRHELSSMGITRYRRFPPQTVGTLRAARFLEHAVPSGHPPRPHTFEYRRRDRSGAHSNAPPEESTSGRGHGLRLAVHSQGHVPEKRTFMCWNRLASRVAVLGGKWGQRPESSLAKKARRGPSNGVVSSRSCIPAGSSLPRARAPYPVKRSPLRGL